MRSAAAKLEFEKAILLRDRIKEMEKSLDYIISKSERKIKKKEKKINKKGKHELVEKYEG